VWKRLEHPNVVPLLGITPAPLQLISEWMPGGGLPEYIKKTPNADRLGLVRFFRLFVTARLPRYQLSDVARGLSYLHSRSVVHGGLKGVRGRSESRLPAVLTPCQPSILVDNSGRARIADFGFATIPQSGGSAESVSVDHDDTARWIAPEISNEQGTYSKEADVFSFAMVMIEVCYGWSPVC
jgi:serine/threonine protein kinase